MRPLGKTTHTILQGLPVSPGLGYGTIHVHNSHRAPAIRREIPEEKVDAEIQRFDEAIQRTRLQLKKIRQMVSARLDKAHAAIFEAQVVLLDDPLLIDTCRREIRAQKLNAEFILEQTVHNMRRLFEQIEAPHLTAQNLDVLDVTARIRENLNPDTQPRTNHKQLKNAIIVAHSLHPSDTARLSGRDIAGIITETGSRTAHFAILAKALKIPAVVVSDGLVALVQEGTQAIIDGFTGRIILEPTKTDLDKMHQRRAQMREEEESLQKLRDLPSETKDGYQVRLLANIEFPGEAAGAKATGAQGIGLFRTEFFYINRGAIPTEEEQFEAYRKVLQEMAPFPVTCRTLDLGGDKLIFGINAPGEKNPFLGMRSIRLCLAHPDLFKQQLHALLRASAFGKMKIMFPLVTDVSEIRQAKTLLSEVQDELRKRGIAFDEKIPLGSMIETPAAALTAERLAAEVDFFSIGTNDLIQYTLAVDRATEVAEALYNPLHPSVIYLIRRTIDAAHLAGIPVSVCGEAASDPGLAVLLAGMGVDELSMNAASLPEVKRLIRLVNLDDIRRLRSDIWNALPSGTAHEVLARFLQHHGARSGRRAPSR